MLWIIGGFIAVFLLVVFGGMFVVFAPLFLILVGFFTHNWIMLIIGVVTAPLWIKLHKKFDEAKKEREAKAAAEKANRMKKYLNK